MDKAEYQKEREQYQEPVSITIRTRVPSKWLFVDQETGHIWRWDQLRETFTAAMLPPQPDATVRAAGDQEPSGKPNR